MLNLYVVQLNMLAFSNAKQSEDSFYSVPPDKEKCKSNLWSACYPFAFSDVCICMIHRLPHRLALSVLAKSQQEEEYGAHVQSPLSRDSCLNKFG